MKKALLIIDRGSREPEVREELEDICTIVKTKAGYYYTNYCFLEVVPPFIEEGIKKCQENGADFITVMPYFLYPGMKLKDSVRQCARICKIQKLNLVITKPLSYHSMMTQVKFCFLELDKPNIQQGIKSMLENNPKVVILMPYFLHRGAHIKRDVVADVNEALKKYPFANTFMTSHLGVDQKLIDLLIERARDVEEKRFGFS